MDLFDRDDGLSQAPASHPRQLAGTSGSFRSSETGSGRKHGPTGERWRPLDGRGAPPAISGRRTSLPRRHIGRVSRHSLEDEYCLETLAGADGEDSNAAMEVSQDAMPVMTSHSRVRGTPGEQRQTSTGTGEASDTGVGTFTANSANGAAGSTRGDRVYDEDSYDIEDDDDDVSACPVPSSRGAPGADVADARQVYISAMSGIGSAATRVSQRPAPAPAPVNSTKLRLANDDGPALIPEEEYTGGDDWLVPDVTTQPSKRKRMDVDYMFRRTDAFLPGTSSGGPSPSQLRASQKAPPLSRKAKRSRQMKLTSMGTTVVSRHSREETRIASPLLEEEDSRPDLVMDFSQMQVGVNALLIQLIPFILLGLPCPSLMCPRFKRLYKVLLIEVPSYNLIN